MESSAPRRSALALVIVLALSALCTLHKLGNRAVWDDVQILAQAADVHAHGGAWRAFTGSTLDALLGDRQSAAAQELDLFRPFALLSFLLGDALGGSDPPLHHLMNTLLHVASVWLVYLLARRLVPGDARVALLSAACFGVTPVLTEAHVWISGRFDLLSTCLGLLALLLWRREQDAADGARAKRFALQIAAAVAWLAGLLSKEPLLFVLPAIVLWPAPGHGLRARLRETLPLWLASAVYLAWRALALAHASVAGTAGAKPLLAAAHLPALLLDGALHVIVPLDVYSRALNEDYAALGAPGLIACGVLLVLVCALVWRARRAHPVLAWSWLWFVCALAPTALVTTRLWPGFGRFLYLPSSLGLVGAADFAIACAARAQPRLQRVLRVTAIAYLGVLCVRSYVAVYDWASDETLFQAIIRAAPERSHGYGFLGMTYLEQRRYPRPRACCLRRWRLRRTNRAGPRGSARPYSSPAGATKPWRWPSATSRASASRPSTTCSRPTACSSATAIAPPRTCSSACVKTRITRSAATRSHSCGRNTRTRSVFARAFVRCSHSRAMRRCARSHRSDRPRQLPAEMRGVRDSSLLTKRRARKSQSSGCTRVAMRASSTACSMRCAISVATCAPSPALKSSVSNASTPMMTIDRSSSRKRFLSMRKE